MPGGNFSADLPAQLCGIEEKYEPYIDYTYDFREHANILRLTMGLRKSHDRDCIVVDVGRKLISLAQIIDRRMTAPEEVLDEWQEIKILSGDASVSGVNGDSLIALDLQNLLEFKDIVFSSRCVLGFKRENVWEELKSQKENVLYLSRDETEEVEGKGFIRTDNGQYISENKTVKKVWDFCARGRSLDDYILSASTHRFNESLMPINLNRILTPDGKSTFALLCADGRIGRYGINVNRVDFGYLHIIGVYDPQKEPAQILAKKTNEGILYNGKLYVPEE